MTASAERIARVAGVSIGLWSMCLCAWAAPAGPAALRVSGNHFVDARGETVQLRGVNVSGLEFVAVQGWSAANPWGGGTGDPTPNWGAMKRWKINAVRIPLNEASWLGYKCTLANGTTRDPDPGRNYRSTVRKAIDGATNAGLYIIIDLHWTAPGKHCPLAQNPMADEDNSILFWSQVAGEFKSSPNVLFELFNEPYFWWLTPGESDWSVMRNGGALTQYVTGDAAKYQADGNWKAAGMQIMLNAVRAAGATNVVLVGAPSWCQDLSKWTANAPDDPLKQMGAVWHAYPNSGTVGDPKAAEPKFGKVAYQWIQSVLDAGYPVVMSEFGDHNAAGTRGAPFVSQVLPWADAKGVSYIGWTWNVWQDKDNVLIKDAGGEPSDGYGVYVEQHLACVDQGKLPCP